METIIRYIIFILEKIQIREIFYTTVYMSILSIIVGCTIYLIQEIFDKKISPKWKLGMWLIFIVSLIIPINIHPEYENKNFILSTLKPIQTISFKQQAKDKQAEYENYIQREDTNFAQYKVVRGNMYMAYVKYAIFDIILPTLWIVVLGICMIRYIIKIWIINKKLKKEEIADKRYIDILEQCKQIMHIKKNIKILDIQTQKAPSICGIVKTKILIDTKYLEDRTEEQIKYMFMHELAHYKGFDLYSHLILNIIKAIHWFNPVCCLFFKRIKQDIELKADNRVLKHLEKEENREYALTIINELVDRTNKSYESEVLHLIGVEGNIERRIYMIKYFPKFKEKNLKIAILSVGLILTIIIIFFVGKTLKIEKDYFGYEYQDIIPYQTQYVGDIEKVKQLIKKLSLGKYLKWIQTEQKDGKYYLTADYYTYGNEQTEPVFYKFKRLNTEEKYQIFKKNAVTMLSLIDNLEGIEIHVKEDSNYETKDNFTETFERNLLEQEYKADLKNYKYEPEQFMKK